MNIQTCIVYEIYEANISLNFSGLFPMDSHLATMCSFVTAISDKASDGQNMASHCTCLFSERVRFVGFSFNKSRQVVCF